MNDAELTGILKSSKTIAVVGLSSNPAARVSGFHVFCSGKAFALSLLIRRKPKCLASQPIASLKDVPDAVDIVNIFRRPARVPEVVDEAIQKGGARCIWMQEGVVSPEGAAKAQTAGIPVVMDRCILKELARLLP